MIEDDFATLVERVTSPDVVVFVAMPVYFSDLSESPKAFLDRLRRTCMHEKKGKAGTGTHRHPLRATHTVSGQGRLSFLLVSGEIGLIN